MEPRGSGRGLSLRVEPSWGETGSGAARLWEEGVADGGSSVGGERASGVEAELGYGGSVRGRGGDALRSAGAGAGGERRYGMGWRLALPGEALELDVEGWRREGTDRPEHGVSFELRVSWYLVGAGTAGAKRVCHPGGSFEPVAVSCRWRRPSTRPPSNVSTVPVAWPAAGPGPVDTE